MKLEMRRVKVEVIMMLLLLVAVVAFGADNEQSATRFIGDGSAADPYIYWGEGEGEEDGLYHSVEGEGEGIGVSVDNTKVGVFTASGWTGAMVGTISFSAGSAAAPSIYPTGDVNTGIYSGTPNTLYFGTDGTLRVTLGTTTLTSTLPLAIPDGTASAPGFYFEAEGEKDGFYSLVEGEEGVGVTVNQSSAGKMMSTGWNGAVVGNTTGQVSFPAGSAASASLYPTGDANTGVYSAGADELNMTTGGTLRLSLSTTALTGTLPILLANGTAANPSFSFATDTNTGLFLRSADGIGFTAGGTERGSISAGGIMQATGGYYASAAGTAVAPAVQIEAGGQEGGIYLGSSALSLAYMDNEVIAYGVNDITLSRSAGVLTETRTVYNAAAPHNTLLLRATRGTLASPDYLSDNDVIGAFKFEGRDGTGTWGDAAEISVQATQQHASAKTGSEIVFKTTANDTDAMAQRARVVNDGIAIESTGAFYLGDPDTDNTWRIIRDGNNLVHQRRESGTYVTKQTITP